MNKYAIPDLDIEATAKAMEADFGEALLDIRQALSEAKSGIVGRVHTPEEIVARRGRPVGSVKPKTKLQTNIRFDGDVLIALKATGRGWQTRVNDLVRREVLGEQRGTTASH